MVKIEEGCKQVKLSVYLLSFKLWIEKENKISGRGGKLGNGNTDVSFHLFSFTDFVYFVCILSSDYLVIKEYGCQLKVFHNDC